MMVQLNQFLDNVDFMTKTITRDKEGSFKGSIHQEDMTIPISQLQRHIYKGKDDTAKGIHTGT